MKYLHIIPHNKTGVVKGYIELICEHFDYTEHEFLLWNNADAISTDGIPSKARIRSENYVDIRIIKSFKLYEKVFFHIMSLNSKQKLYVMLHPKLYKKIVWIPWGKDLYKWRGGFGTTLKSKAAKYITYLFNRNINIFVGIFPTDIAFYKEEFKSRAKIFYAGYIGQNFYKDNPELFEKLYEHKVKIDICDNPINIMIGHNCSTDLKHIDMLDAIERFKDCKIRIYLPLSYDNKVNGNYIEKYAKQKFGEKAVCIREFIDKVTFVKFLQTIDIAIFHTDRQQGLGNINALLMFGKKVYLSNGTVMYDYFKNIGAKIYRFEDIKGISYEEFIKCDDMTNTQIIFYKDLLNIEERIDNWRKVFAYKGA